MRMLPVPSGSATQATTYTSSNAPLGIMAWPWYAPLPLSSLPFAR